jgi:hypothetical protein
MKYHYIISMWGIFQHYHAWQEQVSFLMRYNYQEESVGIPFTGLTQPLVCACSKSKHGFPTSCRELFFMFNELRWEVQFVDIGGIVDHHCIDQFVEYRKQNQMTTYLHEIRELYRVILGEN